MSWVLFTSFTNKSSDCIVCAHEKVGNSTRERERESNKDFFTILKVDYSTLLNFMKVQMSINLTNTHLVSISLLISTSTFVKNKK
jgi:hypothetical protein